MRAPLELLYNFHWVMPGEIARSSQAYLGFLRNLLKVHGIKGVVNLRGSKPGWRWWNYETRVCAELGIAHRDVRFNSRRLPSRAILLDMLDAFDEAPRPLLVKCSGGQDRTSFASALYLLHTRGWSARQRAETQFARWPYLHFPKRQQRWLRVFFEFAEDRNATRTLRDWILRDYTPEDFKAWLASRGLGGAFRGIHAVHEITTGDAE
jgi:protein tyrosine/serine phosphatase